VNFVKRKDVAMCRWLLAGWLMLTGTTAAFAQQDLWEVYHDAGGGAQRRGYAADAEKLWQTALEAAAKDGPKVTYQAATLDNLVALYVDQGRLADAERTLKKILDLYEAANGKDSAAVAGCCIRLGEFYQQEFGNRDADAEPYLRRALAIESKESNVFAAYGPGISLFQCLLFQNKLADAETVLRGCLEVVDKNPGPTQANARAACLHGMAMIHYKRKQDTEAADDYRRALEGLDKAFGPDNPAMLWSLYHTGNFYHTLLGNSTQAEFYFVKALAIAEKTQTSSAGQTSQILLALGQIYHGRHQDEQAKNRFQRALDMANKLPADAAATDRLGVAALRLQIVPFYLDLGKFADAEALCKQSLKQVEEVQGVPQRELGRCYRGLADCCLAQNKLADAEPYARKALAADEKCLGPAHGYVALDLCRLARLARLRNQDAEAEKLCRQALPIAEREVGITRPEVRELVDEYQTLLRKMNRAAEAQQLETRAVNELKLPPARTAAAPPPAATGR
jgi:tetratricopeptide (TPR) repeat protein